MKRNSKNISYLILSVAVFLATSTWLYLIREERIGVYAVALSLIVLSYGLITNPKKKYLLIVDILAIGCIVFFIGLEIYRFFTITV